MVESRPVNPLVQANLERNEALKKQQYMFLAGLLSAGGEINLRVRNHLHARKPVEGKSYGMSQYIVPEIFFYGFDAQVKKLVSQYGGYNYFHSQQDTDAWKIQGHEAIELAKEIREFVPSRAGEFELFLEWESSSKQKRVELRRKLEELRKTRIMEGSDQQREQLQNPIFLAGVFEAAGRIPKDPSGETPEAPRVKFVSRNIGLLNSVGEIYGVNSQPVDPKIRELVLDGEDALKMVEIVKPHLAGPVTDYVKAA